MHRGGLADPLDTFAQSIKKISGKRNKTDADYAEIARLEWYGGLYVDEQQRPCLPAEVVEGTLINAAKKIKRGMQAKAGLLCPSSFPLIYNGPISIDDLWLDIRFRLRSPVIVQRNRVMRTRPMFPEWSVTIDVHYDPSLLNESEVHEIVNRAGEEVGFGDWRPKFGRFVFEIED
jgi:hypothetical protein